MKKGFHAVNWIIRKAFGLVCNIHAADLAKVPQQGPLILVANHVSFLEAPVMYPALDNPNVIAIAKRQSWKNPLFKFLFNLWGIIPIEREMVDREAFARAQKALEENKILVVFPEGTRSMDGQLLAGKPGVVAIAARSKAPMMPVSFYGYEDFWKNLKRFRKTDFYAVVGQPFHLEINGTGLSREVRQEVTDEIMYKIAEGLPQRYLKNYPKAQPYAYRYLTEAGTISNN